MRVHRPSAAATALAVLLAAGAALADPPPKDADAANPNGAAKKELDAKQATELFKRARAYFDPEKNLWKTKKDLREFVEAVAADGPDLKKDLVCLSAVLYQGRSFLEGFDEKVWRVANDVKDFEEKGPYKSISSEHLRFTFVLPDSYPKEEALKKLPRPAPVPLIFSLHEERDFKSDPKWHSGAAALQRRYPKADFPTLYRDYLMFAPVASRAQFVDEAGGIRPEFLTVPLGHFWRRYHVHFDRIFLDGADAAIAMASAQPNYFAGIVLWGGKVDPDLVRNFAPVPVYVVNDEALKKALEAGGHAKVTLGPPSGIAAWMSVQPNREQPDKFHWTLKRSDQQQAYWVSVLSADMTPGVERSLDVEVNRPDNKVSVTAKGIDEIALYLNDTLLNLDDEVEVVLNGKSVQKQRLERRFDDLLPTKDPMNLRKSLYLGWLFPATIQRLEMPAAQGTPPTNGGGAEKPPGGEKPTTTESGSAQDEMKAEIFWGKAAEAEAAGDVEGAKKEYQKILELGPNSKKADAQKKLDELNAK